MSPSTVRALKLFFIAAERAPASAGGEIAQSVVTTAIMVASDGAIIPEPLQRAAMTTSLPPISTERPASLMRVSVVIIASAACSGSGRRLPTSVGAAATILCAGSRWPMTPVEAERTLCAGTSRARATASHTVFTSTRPSGPVSALALPLLTTTARAPLAGKRFSTSRMGAARALFCVRQAAAEQGATL